MRKKRCHPERSEGSWDDHHSFDEKIKMLRQHYDHPFINSDNAAQFHVTAFSLPDHVYRKVSPIYSLFYTNHLDRQSEERLIYNAFIYQNRNDSSKLRNAFDRRFGLLPVIFPSAGP